jgi:hypothetical protein
VNVWIKPSWKLATARNGAQQAGCSSASAV